ncbi:MAG: PmoA family protein, partial [Planctomycetales bacterium]|nr:PmoA family protein [Planctomycetales bacterium]
MTKYFSHLLLVGAFLLGSASFQPLALAQFSVKENEHGVSVIKDGQVVADYLTKSMSKPIIWPLLGPGGIKMTRDYPMVADSKNEKHDHPHHRSLWFTHGDVNGVDFWLEGEKGGITEHLEFTQVSGGDTAVIATRNLWKSPDGKPVLSDHRRFTFHNQADVEVLDCEFLLSASHGDVNFGDTKEGTFGIRI